MSGTDRVHCRLLVGGVVQGVGFRPFVYRTAVSLGLAGFVGNTEEGVIVDLEGPEGDIREFVWRLREDPPPLARVGEIRETRLPLTDRITFEIIPSVSGPAATCAPADVALCEACRRELFDPSDRRFRYPFINCTDCGPRYTLIEGLPYDRPKTTMRRFPLCADCLREYQDPASRRFHAEPIACPVCGPRVWLADASGQPISAADPIAAAADFLASGGILAVKGLGGFHLAADAADETAVARLRRAKDRDRKPFAVMAADLDAVRRFARLDDTEAARLRSPVSPILLLDKADPFGLADSVAPENARIGVMLPYTPLHVLLFDSGRFSALVMTSANPHDEPIVRDNDEAVDRLAGIAERFLFHDRDILARADDSVEIRIDGRIRPIRRSRGYTPLPVRLPMAGPPVLALGGDLKCTVCVTRGDEAFLGPHIGDLDSAPNQAFLLEAVEHLVKLVDVQPEAIGHDLHPDYASSRIARDLCAARFPGIRRIEVQHHHGHILSCFAEHGHTGPGLGIAADGTGYGTDGAAWGGEILVVDGPRFERVGNLVPLRLPGGDRAVAEPWRIAVAVLADLGRLRDLPAIAEHWTDVEPGAIQRVASLVSGPAALPYSSSVGRLFDAVSALLGIVPVSSYEGEAAIRLEQAADLAGSREACPFRREKTGRIDLRPALDTLLDDFLAGESLSVLAARFHATLVAALSDACLAAASQIGLRIVGLSGGAFQNAILLAGIRSHLESAGLTVLTHAQVPTNDGGLSLGQALAALASLHG